MSFRVQLSPQARAQISTINRWWAENRAGAPTLVVAEFEMAIKQLSALPESGRPHDANRPQVRKLLLPRSRYHLYYETDSTNQIVTVLAVWHASRGRGPRL